MKELIIVICNMGSADDVMNTAKEKGAGGGTIIHGRGSAKKDAEHFLGFTIRPEKELVLIITDDTIRNDIMREISKKHGVGTKAHAICFSVPVDATVGLPNRNKTDE
ncbi:MAG: P-II family nitrogen regulator [Bacilli bacterium]|nr:P-II family nitrogen regulator [Bacilli bacterium]MDD7314752.1 P-II family nitrogen regulator [Bacilli bacterium]MDY4052142.1 P-II family nitrogen regulator [Bacilli bacterium]